MAPKKGAAKSGRRSRSASVAVSAGAASHEERQRSKTPVATTRSQKRRGASRQPSVQAADEPKSHAARSTRSARRRGDGSPLATGIEVVETRRSTRRTVSPSAHEVAPLTEDEALQLHIAAEEERSLETEPASTEPEPETISDPTEEVIYETVETEIVETESAEASAQVEADAEAEAEVAQVEAEAAAVEAAAAEAVEAKAEPTEAETMETEQIADEVVVIPTEPPEAISISDSEDDEVPAVIVEEKDEEVEPVEVVEVEETTERAATPQAETVIAAETKHDAVSPPPESESDEDIKDMHIGKHTFLKKTSKERLAYYDMTYDTLHQQRDDFYDELMAKTSMLVALNAELQQARKKISYLESLVRAHLLTCPGNNGQSIAALEATNEVHDSSIEASAAPNDERIAVMNDPELTAMLNQQSGTDFAARIRELQGPDILYPQQIARRRDRAMEKAKQGIRLTEEEQTVITEFEAEQDAERFAKSFAGTPGSFNSNDSLAVSTSEAVEQDLPHDRSAPGGGLTTRLLQTFSPAKYFSPSRLLSGWRTNASPKKSVVIDARDEVLNKTDSPSSSASGAYSSNKRKAIEPTENFLPRGVPRTPRIEEQHNFEEDLDTEMQDSPSFKRQRLERNSPSKMHSAGYLGYASNLSPVSERTEEPSSLQVTLTPKRTLGTTPHRNSQRRSVRQSRQIVSQTPALDRSRKEFADMSSNRRASTRALQAREEETAQSQSPDRSEHMSTATGEKRKTIVPAGAPIPQVREGFGFDYDDYDFEGEDTTMMDASEPDTSNVQAELATVTQEYRQLPSGLQENRPVGMDDSSWLHLMKVKITMHGPSNMRSSSSPKSLDRTVGASPRKMRTPTSVMKGRTEEERQEFRHTGYLPGTATSGAAWCVPEDDSSIMSDLSPTPEHDPSSSTTPTPSPSKPPPSTSTPAAANATPSTSAAAPPTPSTSRRATHEQYKPRQPSRLREETTAQESSDSEPDNQPLTPTEALPADWVAFKEMLACPPGRKLNVSPEFAAWSKQPGWEQGMLDWINRLDLPMSKKNLGVDSAVR